MLLIIDQPYIALNTQPNGKYIIKLVSDNLTKEFVTLKNKINLGNVLIMNVKKNILKMIF